jgi:hypothetical protein
MSRPTATRGACSPFTRASPSTSFTRHGARTSFRHRTDGGVNVRLFSVVAAQTTTTRCPEAEIETPRLSASSM